MSLGPRPRPRSRRPVVAGVLTLVGVVGLLGVLVVSCGDDGDDAARTPTRVAPTGAVDLELGEVTVVRAGGDRPLPDGVAAAVLATAQRYVDAAVVEPLLTGEPVSDLAPLFTAAVRNRVGGDGPDRAALTEEGIPAATADLEVTSAPVPISALITADGTVVWVVASLDVQVDTEVDGGPLTLNRRGDLYVEMTRNGSWRIGAYDMGVSRETDDGTSTSTTTSGAPGEPAPTTTGGD